MTTQTLINRAEMRDAPAERGGRNRPMAAGGASSGTARKEHCCPGTEKLMEAVVERENMLNAFRRVVSNKGAAGVDAMGVDELKPYLQVHWARIKEQLLQAAISRSRFAGWKYPNPAARECVSLVFPRLLTG